MRAHPEGAPFEVAAKPADLAGIYGTRTDAVAGTAAQHPPRLRDPWRAASGRTGYAEIRSSLPGGHAANPHLRPRA